MGQGGVPGLIWKEVAVSTSARAQMVDVTAQVASELAASGITSGVCYVYVPHTTAGVTINENADPDVVTDILVGLERLVPLKGNYRHAEGNSDAHIKASLMGFTVTVPVIGGSLALGTWQGIYFCEFDGPRRRKMLIGIEEK
ncbi:secondary thiamine-phosphate synthase enzyme YjbQ [Methanocella sp.]|uniref:secondary thiamine-phosphate synthase enzyme YjbQ n=1 Tax=Methanocella sp. TaxID=2052833 RepID=UPI002D7F4711|nr:secondary thiamine-phosphate synthase enzyme YjbQ [Methanocella sp.]